MKRANVMVMALALLVGGGCGTAILRDYPNRVVGADGQRIVLDDIQAIVDDPSLPADEKRRQLRDLGLEDELLIEALLGL
jgi:hypothetical protein